MAGRKRPIDPGPIRPGPGPGRPKPKPRRRFPTCDISFSPYIARFNVPLHNIVAQLLYWISDQSSDFDCNGRNCRVIGYPYLEDTRRTDEYKTWPGHLYLVYQTCPGSTGKCTTGGCCLPGGTCVNVKNEAECDAMGSTAVFHLGVPCELITCDPTACCRPNGSCTMQSPDSCLVSGGVPQGEGSNCRPNLCQACCVPFGGELGRCITTTPDDCLSKSGIPQGRRTNCLEKDEFGRPVDHCGTGACCIANADGTSRCEDDTNSLHCLNLWGFFKGLGTSCVVGECPPTGSCCLWDTGCRDTFEQTCNGFQTCPNALTWMGDGTICDTTDCPEIRLCCHNIPPQCDNLSQEDCLAATGTWGEPNDFCCPGNTDPCLGACCLLDGLDCIETDAPSCVSLNNGLFLGFGTNCQGIDCPQIIGACCHRPTGDPFEDRECIQAPLEFCNTLFDSEFMGVGLPCSSALCVDRNACCLPFPGCGCNEVVTEAECDGLGGVYWPNQSCEDIQNTSCLCPGDPLCVGFCCGNPDTVDCDTFGGDPQGRPCCRSCLCCKAICINGNPSCCTTELLGWDSICADAARDCCTASCWDTCGDPAICQFLGIPEP